MVGDCKGEIFDSFNSRGGGGVCDGGDEVSSKESLRWNNDTFLLYKKLLYTRSSIFLPFCDETKLPKGIII